MTGDVEMGAVAQCPNNWGVGSAFHPKKMYIYITREVAAENIGIPRVGLLRWLDRSNAALATLWVHERGSKITFNCPTLIVKRNGQSKMVPALSCHKNIDILSLSQLAFICH